MSKSKIKIKKQRVPKEVGSEITEGEKRESESAHAVVPHSRPLVRVGGWALRLSVAGGVPAHSGS